MVEVVALSDQAGEVRFVGRSCRGFGRLSVPGRYAVTCAKTFGLLNRATV